MMMTHGDDDDDDTDDDDTDDENLIQYISICTTFNANLQIHSHNRFVIIFKLSVDSSVFLRHNCNPVFINNTKSPATWSL